MIGQVCKLDGEFSVKCHIIAGLNQNQGVQNCELPTWSDLISLTECGIAVEEIKIHVYHPSRSL